MDPILPVKKQAQRGEVSYSRSLGSKVKSESGSRSGCKVHEYTVHRSAHRHTHRHSARLGRGIVERPLPPAGRTQAAGPLAGLTGLTRGPPGSGCCSEKRRLGFGFRFSSASFITYCVALETVSPLSEPEYLHL